MWQQNGTLPHRLSSDTPNVFLGPHDNPRLRVPRTSLSSRRPERAGGETECGHAQPGLQIEARESDTPGSTPRLLLSLMLKFLFKNCVDPTSWLHKGGKVPQPAPGKCWIIPERRLLLSLPERSGGLSHPLEALSRARRQRPGPRLLTAQSTHLPAAEGHQQLPARPIERHRPNQPLLDQTQLSPARSCNARFVLKYLRFPTTFCQMGSCPASCLLSEGPFHSGPESLSLPRPWFEEPSRDFYFGSRTWWLSSLDSRGPLASPHIPPTALRSGSRGGSVLRPAERIWDTRRPW